MINNYLYLIILIIIIINFISYNFLDYKYKLLNKQKIIDLLFDPSYWVWIGIYFYSKETKNITNILILKIFFIIIYYIYLIKLFIIFLQYRILLIFIILTIIVHIINYIILKKKFITININKSFLDYLSPYYIISIYYYLFENNIYNNCYKYKKIIFRISRYIFSFNFIYIIYLLYLYIILFSR